MRIAILRCRGNLENMLQLIRFSVCFDRVINYYFYIKKYNVISASHAKDFFVEKWCKLVYIFMRAILGQIQGGLQKASQDSTKGGLQYFFTFYTLKISLFRVLR